MKTIMYWKRGAVFIVLLFAVNAVHAGWVFQHMSGDVMYIASGKSKEVSGDDGTWSVYDGTSGNISMISDEKRLYWQGSVNELCKELKKMVPQMGESPPRPEVNIDHEGSESIAGLKVQKYRVMADGQLYEEIWVAENKNLEEEMKLLLKYEKELMECSPAQTMEEMVGRDPGYEKIVNGYVMKQVTYESGMEVEGDEVVSVEQKDIPGSKFDVPAGYRRVGSLMEIWM